MIRRKYIPDILNNTFTISNKEEVRLDDLYGINPDASQDKATRKKIKQNKKKFIEVLLSHTNGHPRSMMLLMCQNSTSTASGAKCLK